MKKRNNALVLLLMLILFSCCFLVSCADKRDEQRDAIVKIGIEGVSHSNRITVFATNNSTEDEVEIEFRKRDQYTCYQQLDYGDYTVTEVKTNNRDCEINLVSTQFFVTADSSDEITIRVEEKDISWTLKWFWQNNAFAIVTLVILCVALVVIKWRKNRIAVHHPWEIK